MEARPREVNAVRGQAALEPEMEKRLNMPQLVESIAYAVIQTILCPNLLTRTDWKSRPNTGKNLQQNMVFTVIECTIGFWMIKFLFCNCFKAIYSVFYSSARSVLC